MNSDFFDCPTTIEVFLIQTNFPDWFPNISVASKTKYFCSLYKAARMT